MKNPTRRNQRSIDRRKKYQVSPQLGKTGKSPFSLATPTVAKKSGVPAGNTILTPQSRVETTTEIKVVDAIVTNGGKEYVLLGQGARNRWVPRTMFSRGGGGPQHGLTALKAADMPVFSAADEKGLIHQIQNTTSFRTLDVIEGPGWTGNHFALQDGIIISPRGEETPPLVFNVTTGRLDTLGTSVNWRRRVAAIFVGQPIGELVLSAAFVPPVMELLGITSNFGIDLNGVSGSFKSHLQFVGASVYGPSLSSSSNYRHTLNGTIAGLEELLPSHNGTLFVLEEMGLLANKSPQASGAALFDLTMRLSHGDPRRRHGSTVGTGASSRCVWLTSSNKSLEQLLVGRDRAEIDAIKARVYTIHVPKRATGIFEFIPDGFDSIQAAVSHLRAQMARYHGAAIRSFLQRLVVEHAEDPEQLIASLRQGIESFKARIQLDGLAGHQRTRAESMAIIASVGALAQRYRVLPSSFDPEASVLACYADMMQETHAPVGIVDRLIAWLQTNDFYDIRSGELVWVSDDDMRTRGVFVRSGLRKRVEVVVTQQMLERIFPDRAAVLSQAAASGLLLHDLKSYSTRRLVRLGHLAEKVICFVIPHNSI